MIRQRPQWAKCTTEFTDRLMHHNRCKAHAKSHCMESQCRWRANVEAHKQNMHTNSKSKCGSAQAETCTNVEASVTEVKHTNTKELKTQKIQFTCMQQRETASPMQARCECMCKLLQQSGMSTARALRHPISRFSHHFSCPCCGKLCVGVLLICCGRLWLEVADLLRQVVWSVADLLRQVVVGCC